MIDDEFELGLDSVAFGGDAVGRHEGKVCFVPLGAPGDRARVKVVQERKSFCRAELVEVISAGPGRREPPCPLAGTCGGCQLQHLAYPQQLEAKQQAVEQALGTRVEQLLPMVRAPQELGYRRRVRLHWVTGVQGKVVLGFHQRRSRTIVDVDRCPLLVPPLQQAMDHCRQHLGRLPRARGSLVLLAGDDGAVHASLHSRAGGRSWRVQLEALASEQPLVGLEARLGRLQLNIDREAVTLAASGVGLPGVALEASAAAFAQANPAQDSQVRGRVHAWAAAAGCRVLELYAGIGNLTAAVAPGAQEVVAVESSHEAAYLLRRNAKGMGTPVKVMIKPVAQALARLAGQEKGFDVVLLDPPREGARGLGEALSILGASRVVYVSCDPMTLARDLAEMDQAGFSPRQAEPLDMMPQTYHTEAVVLLTRK